LIDHPNLVRVFLPQLESILEASTYFPPTHVSSHVPGPPYTLRPPSPQSCIDPFAELGWDDTVLDGFPPRVCGMRNPPLPFFHPFFLPFIRPSNHQLARLQYSISCLILTIPRLNLLSYMFIIHLPLSYPSLTPSAVLSLPFPFPHSCALYILQAYPTFLIPMAFSLMLSWVKPTFVLLWRYADLPPIRSFGSILVTLCLIISLRSFLISSGSFAWGACCLMYIYNTHIRIHTLLSIYLP